MTEKERNLLMVSADRWVVAGDKGPFYYMLEAFHQHWDRIDVIGTRPEKMDQKTVFDNVHLHHPTSGKIVQAGFIARTGKALCQERSYAVITSHDYSPPYNGLGAWRISRGSGVPYVAEIHHVPGFPKAATLRERLDKVVMRCYAKWAAGRAAGFRVVNSTELPPLLKAWGVPEERIHVLPSLYLDLETFCPGSKGKKDAPTSDLLMVGRLVPNKGVLQTLEALHRLIARGMTGTTLTLVGRGPLEETVDQFVASRSLQDYVTRIPWVENSADLATVYRQSRILVCASTSEGGPRIVGEAMACGTPVISTRVGIAPEMISHQENGLLYDGTVEHLTLLLQRFLTDAKQEMALRSNLPGDLSSYGKEKVIARLAEGLMAISKNTHHR